MKKDHIRDYATEAFRFYAANGMNTEQFKDKIRQEALEEKRQREERSGNSCGGSPTEHELIYQEEKLQERISEILDMEGVEKTIEEYKVHHNAIGKETLKLIEMVYFKDANRELEKNDISIRVDIAAEELNISSRTAYRYLKNARRLFAFNRGLRVD